MTDTHEGRECDGRDGEHRNRDHREITLISTDAGGDQLNGISVDPVASENGRYIAFISYASDVLPSDPNTRPDLYLKDVRTGEVTLISANAQGIVGNEGGGFPAFGISNNGRYVAFNSNASNLVPDDSNGNIPDVFVKDVRTGEVTLISTDGQGQQGNGESQSASISDAGRYVAFESSAMNLAPDDTNENLDVFVKDLQTGRLVLASSDVEGNEGDNFSGGPSISGNGRFVAFHSLAQNLVPDDTNEDWDVFVKDLRTGEIARASTDSHGNQADDVGLLIHESFGPPISANGRYVAFQSTASLVLEDTDNFTDVYVKDLRTDAVTLVSTNLQGSAGNSSSGDASISGNGRYVAFTIVGDDNGDSDVYVKDLWSVEVTLISEGGPGNPYVTNDGDVVFFSSSSDLVVQDTNGLFDIFLWA